MPTQRTHNYWFYIIANATQSVLYIGMTNNIERRVAEHVAGNGSGFASRYKTTKLVYYEHTTSAEAAIQREKQIKGWRREKKVSLIKASNPDWRDLSSDWQEDTGASGY